MPTAARTVAQVADLGVATGGADGPGTAPDRSALRRCTSLEPDRFAAEVWGRTVSLSRRERWLSPEFAGQTQGQVVGSQQVRLAF